MACTKPSLNILLLHKVVLDQRSFEASRPPCSVHTHTTQVKGCSSTAVSHVLLPKLQTQIMSQPYIYVCIFSCQSQAGSPYASQPFHFVCRLATAAQCTFGQAGASHFRQDKSVPTVSPCFARCRSATAGALLAKQEMATSAPLEATTKPRTWCSYSMWHDSKWVVFGIATLLC